MLQAGPSHTAPSQCVGRSTSARPPRWSGFVLRQACGLRRPVGVRRRGQDDPLARGVVVERHKTERPRPDGAARPVLRERSRGAVHSLPGSSCGHSRDCRAPIETLTRMPPPTSATEHHAIALPGLDDHSKFGQPAPAASTCSRRRTSAPATSLSSSTTTGNKVLKKGRLIQPDADRARIVDALRCVDDVLIAVEDGPGVDPELRPYYGSTTRTPSCVFLQRRRPVTLADSLRRPSRKRRARRHRAGVRRRRRVEGRTRAAASSRRSTRPGATSDAARGSPHRHRRGPRRSAASGPAAPAEEQRQRHPQLAGEHGDDREGREAAEGGGEHQGTSDDRPLLRALAPALEPPTRLRRLLRRVPRPSSASSHRRSTRRPCPPSGRVPPARAQRPCTLATATRAEPRGRPRC